MPSISAPFCRCSPTWKDDGLATSGEAKGPRATCEEGSKLGELIVVGKAGVPGTSGEAKGSRTTCK